MSIRTRSMSITASTHISLNGTGDKMPTLGLGTWLSDPGDVYRATKCALDAGYRHIDEAWVYMNEQEVGQALLEKLGTEDGRIPRSEVFITSKLWNNFHRPEKVEEGCRESLEALKLDYLDLYLIHFPVCFQPDVIEATKKEELDAVPLADTWKAMEALVEKGLVKNIGVSNFEIEQLKEVQAVATLPIAVNQFETQPYYQRNELVSYCHAHDIVVTAHTSLGSPANVMSSHHNSPPLMEDPVVGKIAAATGKTPAQVLLRWALQRPTIVLPKSVTPARIESNADLYSFELSAEQVSELNALDKPGLEGCFNHPLTPWLGRSDFTGSTSSYCDS